jgi:hypothetical protein
MTGKYNLIAELLPQIEETYKTSVCGYDPFFEGTSGSPSAVSATDRWKREFEIWLPIPKLMLEDSAEDLPAVQQRLTDLKLVKSVEVIMPGDPVPDSVGEAMSVQDLGFIHLICVPFRDLVIC